MMKHLQRGLAWLRQKATPMGFLNPIIDYTDIQERAKAEARRLTERFDVPDPRTVPEDLADSAPRFFLTKDRLPLASHVLIEDMSKGSDSASTPLVIGLLPVLLAFTYAALGVASILGSWATGLVALVLIPLYLFAVGSAMVALWQSEDVMKMIIYVAWSTVLPLMALAGLGVLGQMVSNMASSGTTGQLISAASSQLGFIGDIAINVGSGMAGAIGFGFLAAGVGIPLGLAVMFFMKDRWQAGRIMKVFAKITLVAMASIFLTLALGFWAGMIPWFIAACRAPVSFARGNHLERADRLGRQAREAQQEVTMMTTFLSAASARAEQGKAASKDSSEFIPYGTAKGVMTLKFDSYGPDAGLPFGQTLRDLSTHMMVFGPTGSGKTSGFLRPFTVKLRKANNAQIKKLSGDLRKQVIAWRRGGMSAETNPYAVTAQLEIYKQQGRLAIGVALSSDDLAEVKRIANPDQTHTLTSLEALMAKDAETVTAEDVFYIHSTLAKLSEDALAKVREQLDRVRSVLNSKGALVLEDVPGRNPLTGMLLMDGKGALANELRALSDLTIEPGVPLGILEGLSDEDVMMALQSCTAAGKAGASDGGGNEAFWTMGSLELARHTWVLTSAMAVHEQRFIEALKNPALVRQWKRTISHWISVCRGLEAISFNKAQSRWELHANLQGILNFLEGKEIRRDEKGEVIHDEKGDPAFFPSLVGPHPDLSVQGSLLSQAVEFVRAWPGKDEKERSGFMSTLVNTWLSPFMANSQLSPWAYQETGVDPTICLRGGVVGLNIPVTDFGLAGRLIQSFIKQRISSLIRRRGGYNWQIAGESSCVFLMDEAQELLNKQDADTAAVARSLGLVYKAATQDVEGVIGRMGNEQLARNLLNQFRSFALVGLCSPLTVEWAKARVGAGFVRQFPRNSVGVDFVGTLSILKNHPALYANHPDQDAFRQRTLQGALVFKDGKKSKPSEINRGYSNRNVSEFNDIDHAMPVLMGGEFKQQAMLEETDIYLHNAMRNVAFIQVERAGVVRRDFVDLEPIYSVDRVEEVTE